MSPSTTTGTSSTATSAHAFGTHPVGEIVASDVKQWSTDLHAAGYEHSTVEGIIGLLSRILADAVEDGLLPANPVHRHHRRVSRVQRGAPEPDRREPVGERVQRGDPALRDDDIDPQWCLLQLRENDTTRWQLASPTLITALLHHRDQRGTGHPSAERLLRRRDGAPITSRYDYIWNRMRTEPPVVTTRASAPTGYATPHSPG